MWTVDGEWWMAYMAIDALNGKFTISRWATVYALWTFSSFCLLDSEQFNFFVYLCCTRLCCHPPLCITIIIIIIKRRVQIVFLCVGFLFDTNVVNVKCQPNLQFWCSFQFYRIFFSLLLLLYKITTRNHTSKIINNWCFSLKFLDLGRYFIDVG